MRFLILSVASFIVSLLSVALLKQRLSQHLLDIPNERSSHTQPIPRGGGLGFLIAFALTSAIATYEGQMLTGGWIRLLQIGLILLPLAILGMIDDQHGVPAGVRYLIHLLTAGVAIACFGDFPQPWFTSLGVVGTVIAFTLSIIGMTALINFYNFMDGLDGLVAGVSAVQLSFLALYLNQPLFWLLVAALLGFLWWNWSPAKIFMGDVGSTVLGASVAIALLNGSNETNPIQAWSALAVTLPLVSDAIYTLVCRLSRRENIFQAHRTHLYQRLHQVGWSHAQVALTYIGLTLLCALSIGGFGLLGAYISLVSVSIYLMIGELYLQRHVLKKADQS